MIQNTFELQQIISDPTLTDEQKAARIGVSVDEYRHQRDMLAEGKIVASAHEPAPLTPEQIAAEQAEEKRAEMTAAEADAREAAIKETAAANARDAAKSAPTPAVRHRLSAEPAAADNAPAVEGAPAWAAAFNSLFKDGPQDATMERLTVLVTNCLRDGYDQGVTATAASAVAAPQPQPQPAPKPAIDGIHDDVLRAAEEAAYATSNQLASAHGRKQDDGIVAWRNRTGGLRRVRHAA